MLRKNKDLYGSAPDECKAAMLIIDMINDFDFEDGDQLLVGSLPVAEKIFKLKQKAIEAGVPVIYVNDNFGRWKSNFNVIVDHCIHDNTKGRKIAELLKPQEDDYFVLKPKHSGFFCTTLELLLEYLNAETLILTGITTDICILFTANDAYMRDFKIVIPSDCTAAVTSENHSDALKSLERIVKADIRSSDEIDLRRLN